MKMTKNRTTQYRILDDSQKNFLQAWTACLEKQGLEPDYIDYDQGSLQDNFAIDFGTCRYGRLSRRYCLGIERYLNCWSSDTLLVFTDSDRLLSKFLDHDYSYFLNRYEKQQGKEMNRLLAALS